MISSGRKPAVIAQTAPELLIDREKPIGMAAVKADTEAALAAASAENSFSFKVLTVNIHKGFTFFNRKFILPELRDAVRSVGADVVFLQEVTGNHIKHPDKFDNFPEAPHYEFLADTIWPQFAYGKTPSTPMATTAMRCCPNFPSCVLKIVMSRSAGPSGAGCCTAS